MGIKLIKYGMFSSSNIKPIQQHNDLEGRDFIDQHPISAITGLIERLEEMAEGIENAANKNVINEIIQTIEEMRLQIENSVQDEELLVVTNRLDELQKRIENSSASTVVINQTSHGFVVGNAICYDETMGLYTKGNAKLERFSQIVGVVKEIANENEFTMITSGFFKTPLYDTYQMGTILYLNATGELSDTSELCCVHMAIKIDGGILIRIESPYTLTTEDELTNFMNTLV